MFSYIYDPQPMMIDVNNFTYHTLINVVKSVVI